MSLGVITPACSLASGMAEVKAPKAMVAKTVSELKNIVE